MQPGTRLGPYEIVAPLGAGGMGEVYRARDTRLDRDVAVKVLPEAVAHDPDRLVRFEREARAVAALSHPNVLAVHDVAREGESPYVVTELLEGQTLREALRKGPLPVSRALDYGAQVARGLAAAHERGIVHRDLKPENLFVSRDGTVKILDFGLARLHRIGTEGSEISEAATQTFLTEQGTILGTVAYMSPEQVRGQELDHRTDIFSFGTILYEMLTGRHPFQKESTADTMSAVLGEDPPGLNEVEPSIPPHLARIAGHCLEKSPARRFQSAHDLAFDLEAQAVPTATSSRGYAAAAPRRSRGRRAAWVLAALLALLLAGATGAWLASRGAVGEAPSARQGKRFQQLTFREGIESFPALSPDGQEVVYSAGGPGGDVDLFLQRTDGRAAFNLTAGSTDDDLQAAFSPDGREIAFRIGVPHGGIYVMGARGESVRKVADFGFNPSWSPDGESLVVATEPTYLTPETKNSMSSLWILDVRTGQRRLLLEADGMQPSWSPNGERIAYWGNPTDSWQRDLWTVSATADGPEQTVVRVTDDEALDWNPVWSPDGRYLYFGSDRDGTRNLWRVAIDESTGEVREEPEPVTLPGRFVGHFSVAATQDLLAFSTIESELEVTRARVDGGGERIGEWSRVFGGTLALHSWDVAPDGSWIVLATGPPQQDLLMVRADGEETRQLTNDRAIDRGPSFSPDGSEIYFYSDREDDRYEIWKISSEGGGLTRMTALESTALWYPILSPDGSKLAGYNQEGCSIVDLGGPLPVRVAERLPPYGDGSELFRCLDWAPDGRMLLGALSDPATGGRVPGVAVYRLDRGIYELIDEGGSPIGVTGDGSTLVADGDETRWIDLSGNVVRRVVGEVEASIRQGMSTQPSQTSFLVSRDGSTIYLRTLETEADVWMVELSGGGE